MATARQILTSRMRCQTYIPPLMAVGAVHHHLLAQKLRLEASLVTETAQVHPRTHQLFNASQTPCFVSAVSQCSLVSARGLPLALVSSAFLRR